MKVSLVEVYHCRTPAFLPACKFTVQWRTGTSVILGTLSLEIKRPDGEANHSFSSSDIYLLPPSRPSWRSQGKLWLLFHFNIVSYTLTGLKTPFKRTDNNRFN